jgi:pimeloyl-ACP methyl ester carboxylesterase
MTPAPGPALPAPISATAGDLPPTVARALGQPERARRLSIEAAGLTWAASEWGPPDARPLLLIHGVTSSSATWWRTGPALAAAGYRTVAVDQAGHGATGRWLGHHRFRDNAGDVAAFARATGLARDDLRIVGHSWGALTAAHLAAAGLVPAVLVLLDPPTLTRSAIATLLEDPTERRYEDLPEAIAAVRLAYPGWSEGDVLAKAEGLTAFDEAAVRAVLLENEWDGGLAGLADPAARDGPVWIVRGEPAAGSFVTADALPALAARVGPQRLLTIAGGPHSPQRTHPEATLVALLTALGRPGREPADVGRTSTTSR